MVVNKSSLPATILIVVTNFLHTGVAQGWQLASANSIYHLPDLAFASDSFSNQIPAQSITLLVFPSANSPRLRAGNATANGTFQIWLDGTIGQKYFLEATTNFIDWLTLQTNTLSSNSIQINIIATNAPARFYRAVWSP
jgi:hypothetical protein